MMEDSFGRTLAVGDRVYVNCIDASRGARAWMAHGTVVGFGKTRVKVHFSYDTKPFYAIGSECLSKVIA